MADEVMAAGTAKPDWSFSRVSVGTALQKRCACGGSGGSGGECEECKEKKTLQRKASGPVETGVAPPIVHEVLRSPGQPLDNVTRSFFEPRFGHDLSRVKVHTDDRAATSAKAVDALAYTVGSDVVFGAGQYPPGTTSGRALLAHELTHVVQQASSSAGEPANLSIDRSEPAEAEASETASALITADKAAMASRNAKRLVQRAPLSLQRSTAKTGAAARVQRAPPRLDAPHPIRVPLASRARAQSGRWSSTLTSNAVRGRTHSTIKNLDTPICAFRRIMGANTPMASIRQSDSGRKPAHGGRLRPPPGHATRRVHRRQGTYSLTQDQYNAGLHSAQRICGTGHAYGEHYTCTTFADDVARGPGRCYPHCGASRRRYIISQSHQSTTRTRWRRTF